MKKVVVASLIVLMVLGIGILFAQNDGYKGNDLPKGKCYNLNIIGLPKGVNYSKELNDNFTGGNGKRIFIQRTGTTQFFVYGDDTTGFEVIDHNGTDGKIGTSVSDPGITFPYDEDTDTWQAEIWLRLVGPMDPGNTLNWKTYYDWDGSVWLQWTSFNLSKSSKFTLKTSQILIDGYQNLLWELTPGDKFRIVQMRIYLD